MENIKWIHWFWITILCVINFQNYPVITYALHPTDVDGNIGYNTTSLLLHRINEKLLNDTGNEEIIETKILTNDTTQQSQNLPNPTLNIEINKNYNKSDSMNITEAENINDNNNNTVILNPKLNNTETFNINQNNLDFKDHTTSISQTSTNLTSSLPSIKLQRDSVNINNLKKSIASQEDTSNFNKKLIEVITSKSIESDTTPTSINTEDPSVVEVQDNLTNLDNFINSKRRAKGLSSEYRNDDVKFVNYSITGKNLLIRSAESVGPIKTAHHDEGNVSSEALSYKSMDAGVISGICFAAVALCCGIVTSGLILYRRRRYLNKPHALSEPDSGYIDDSIIRDTNSDELYSLDNDSFLNSLEAMTIQNYWSETVKHTKL